MHFIDAVATKAATGSQRAIAEAKALIAKGDLGPLEARDLEEGIRVGIAQQDHERACARARRDHDNRPEARQARAESLLSYYRKQDEVSYNG